MNPNFEKICAELKAEFPTFKIVPKRESWLMWAQYYLMLMFLWNKEYMDRFTTVFRCTVYMPERLIGTYSGYMTLRHERIHMRDSKGWRIIYYGPMYILLPIGPSGRAYWELRAYKESMRVYYETYRTIPDSMIEWWTKHFYDSSYLYMWPFPNHIRKLLKDHREELYRGN